MLFLTLALGDRIRILKDNRDRALRKIIHQHEANMQLKDKVNRELPKEKPRHLLGIGEPEDIFIGVAAGIDTFDCVLPTRNGRNGGIYTKNGKIQIPNKEIIISSLSE